MGIRLRGVDYTRPYFNMVTVKRADGPFEFVCLVGNKFVDACETMISSCENAEAEVPGKAPIALLNGERMIDLMLENRIGVKPEEATLFEIDDEFFA